MQFRMDKQQHSTQGDPGVPNGCVETRISAEGHRDLSPKVQRAIMGKHLGRLNVCMDDGKTNWTYVKRGDDHRPVGSYVWT